MKTYYLNNIAGPVIRHLRSLHASAEGGRSSRLRELKAANKATIAAIIAAVMNGKVIYTVSNNDGYRSFTALHKSPKEAGKMQISFFHVNRSGAFIPIMDSQRSPEDLAGIYKELKKGCYIEYQEGTA